MGTVAVLREFGSGLDGRFPMVGIRSEAERTGVIPAFAYDQVLPKRGSEMRGRRPVPGLSPEMRQEVPDLRQSERICEAQEYRFFLYVID